MDQIYNRLLHKIIEIEEKYSKIDIFIDNFIYKYINELSKFDKKDSSRMETFF